MLDTFYSSYNEPEGAERKAANDTEKIAEGISLVAQALRKEGLSEGQIRAALLAICGVRVDDPLVRHLMRFQ